MSLVHLVIAYNFNSKHYHGVLKVLKNDIFIIV